jgi:flagellar basal-body rod protein FlgG
MNGAFYIGATGLEAQQRALDIVANNIANINTPAYKRAEVRFSELLGPRLTQEDGAAKPDELGTLSGVGVAASPRIFSQGDLHATGKPLDLAIDGDGFIELLGPAGQDMLWRGGTLKISADGSLAAANGMALKSAVSGPTGASAISIDREGKVQAQVDGETVDIGQIDLVLVKDTTSLTAVGDGLYQTADPADLMSASVGEDGAGWFAQGSLEASNVQLSDEMVSLLLLQRAYGANAQVLQAGDQLMAIANNLKR